MIKKGIFSRSGSDLLCFVITCGDQMNHVTKALHDFLEFMKTSLRNNQNNLFLTLFVIKNLLKNVQAFYWRIDILHNRQSFIRPRKLLSVLSNLSTTNSMEETFDCACDIDQWLLLGAFIKRKSSCWNW